jgi:hypothetical protein
MVRGAGLLARSNQRQSGVVSKRPIHADGTAGGSVSSLFGARPPAQVLSAGSTLAAKPYRNSVDCFG